VFHSITANGLQTCEGRDLKRKIINLKTNNNMKTEISMNLLTHAFASVLLAVVLSSCEPQPKREPKEVIEYKVVKDKKEKMETHYKHVFSVWKGDFVLQPDIKTEYYIIYKDGSYDNVEVGKYSITEIGDTIVNKRMVY
jgi:hypothetical protein